MRGVINNVTVFAYVKSSEVRLLRFLNVYVDRCRVFQMNMNRRSGSFAATDCYRVLCA